MSIYQYFKQVLEDGIATAASSSGLKDVEEQEVKKQLKLFSAPKPKKQHVSYGQYDAKTRAEIAKWGIIHGILPGA